MYPYVSDMYRECILCVMYLRVKIHCILNAYNRIRIRGNPTKKSRKPHVSPRRQESNLAVHVPHPHAETSSKFPHRTSGGPTNCGIGRPLLVGYVTG